MTRCSCCQTPHGPFVRDRDLPGRPVCGLAPRERLRGPVVELETRARIQACLARRRELEAATMPGAQPVAP